MNNLVGIADLTADELTELLDAADAWRGRNNRPAGSDVPLAGRVIVNLFMEPSTRTRLSFETAAKRLGADVLNFTASGSSVEKGETLHDTLRTVEAMQPDVIVLRHGASGAAMYAAGRVRCAIVNAGDDAARLHFDRRGKLSKAGHDAVNDKFLAVYRILERWVMKRGT